MNSWRPSANIENIQLRAQFLGRIRHFFLDRGVLEVDTPVLSSSTTTDPFIESFTSSYEPLMTSLGERGEQTFYLHTSPEFPMKRLLSAGSGSIYQIAKVFRQGEIGRWHNPEFTLLEWYRVGYDYRQLMQEVADLLMALMPLTIVHYSSYQQAFEKMLGINPHTARVKDLMRCCSEYGLAGVLSGGDDKDRFLELLFSHKIEPELGKAEGQPVISFIYDFPETQASLARVRKQDDFRVAERFEVYINGIELANGFHELADKQEQRQRFIKDNEYRAGRGQSRIPLDERFLASLDNLPDCSGVAMGLERLLMVMTGCSDIKEVITFPFERA